MTKRDLMKALEHLARCAAICGDKAAARVLEEAALYPERVLRDPGLLGALDPDTHLAGAASYAVQRWAHARGTGHAPRPPVPKARRRR